MAQQLRALDVLSEYLGLSLSTHKVAHNHLRALHTGSAQTDMQTKHSYT